MKRLFGSTFDIRKGELAITLLMLANYFLILTTYYLLKPARDSLFLTKVSPEQLPLVFIITALVIAPITTLYARAAQHMQLNRLINLTSGIIIVNLFILRWLITFDSPWVYYLFYTWVSIYGALTTSQFWLLANATYDAAQAKRLFVLLGLAGIIGAISGGTVTSLIVETFGVATENLLFFCAGFLGVTMLLVTTIWRKRDPEAGKTAAEIAGTGPKPEKDSFLDLFKLINKSRHLLLLVGIGAVTVAVASFADYQFKVIAEHEIPAKDDLTAFLGKFYSGLSLASLILQAGFAHRFLRWLGVGGVILFLPASLALGSSAVLLAPGGIMLLYAGIFLRGADGSLRYSLDKTSRELLFLPVPLEVKKKTKVFIDMFVDRWSRGVAGALLLLCTFLFSQAGIESVPDRMRWISVLVLGFVAVWMIMGFIMRRRYVDTFRKALEKREIDHSEIRQAITDSSTIRTLLTSLESDNEREVAYALQMLRSAPAVETLEPVRPLLNHRSAEIRRYAIELLRENPEETLLKDMNDLVNDPDPEVRCEAIRYLCDHPGNDRARTVRVFLNHPDIRIRSSAIASVGLYGEEQEKSMVHEDMIDAILADKSETADESRRQLVRALANLDLPNRRKYLQRLLRDKSLGVVTEAARTAGRIKDREFVPWLLDKLADRHLRAVAIKALVDYGSRIHGTLRDYLLDSSVPNQVRRNIPRVLSQIPEQESVAILADAIPELEPHLKYFAVKGLNSLRTRYDNLRFDSEKIDDVLIQETRTYYELLQVLFRHNSGAKTDSAELLSRAILERLDLNLERIFRLLGLCYPPKDIYSAYLGLVSDKRALRASAVEFLDNLLRGDIKKYLFPIIDEGISDRVVRRGEEFFGTRFPSTRDALAHLIGGRDPWLRACALFHAGHERMKPLADEMRKATGDRDPVVRETAELAMRLVERIEPNGNETKK